MLDRVLKFFITSFLAIAGGALFHLLAPILTDFLSTEVLQTDLGILLSCCSTQVEKRLSCRMK